MAKKINKLPNQVWIGEQYKTISGYADVSGEYKGFKNKFSELSNEENINQEEWEEFFRNYWGVVFGQF